VNYLSGAEYVLGAIAMGLLAGQRGLNVIAVSLAGRAMGLIGCAIASVYTLAVPYVDVTNLAAAAGVGMLVALRFPVGPTAVAGTGYRW
jgi:hypothetical protein